MLVVSTAAKLTIPRWVLVWFIISAVIQTYDACYILLGPISHEGGPMAGFWAGHVLYGQYDKTYGGNASSAWGDAQSWLNLVEVIGLVVVFFNLRKPLAAVLGLIVSVATFWKTVAYFTIEATSGLEKTIHSINSGDIAGFLFIGVLPNLFWIVLPFLVIVSLGRRMNAASRLSLQTQAS